MFKCKGCQKLAEENRYLRTLVDRLLEKVGVAPVEPSLPIGTQAFNQDESTESQLPVDRIGI